MSIIFMFGCIPFNLDKVIILIKIVYFVGINEDLENFNLLGYIY